MLPYSPKHVLAQGWVWVVQERYRRAVGNYGARLTGHRTTPVGTNSLCLRPPPTPHFIALTSGEGMYVVLNRALGVYADFFRLSYQSHWCIVWGDLHSLQVEGGCTGREAVFSQAFLPRAWGGQWWVRSPHLVGLRLIGWSHHPSAGQAGFLRPSLALSVSAIAQGHPWWSGAYDALMLALSVHRDYAQTRCPSH